LRKELDTAQAQLQLAKARYNLLRAGTRKEEIDQARADIVEAKAAVELAQRDHERTRELYTKGGASAQDMDTAKARLEQAASRLRRVEQAVKVLEQGPRKEQLEVAEAEILVADAQVKMAQIQVEYTVLRAPINGIVLSMHADLGQYLNPNNTIGPAAICDL